MRFSEKSFEVRFCSALSAAAMPYARNPQWFGMTQAQERMTGIDTMLRLGGTLLIFQFKAKSDGKFKLEKQQWRCLSRLEARYPNSTSYILPEADDVAAAAKMHCLLNHSWCCSPKDIGPLFKVGAKSTTLTLNTGDKCLSKARPKKEATAQRACQVFGCFCPPEGITFDFPGSPSFWVWPSPAPALRATGTLLPMFGGSVKGIPIGDGVRDDTDRKPLLSPGDFEELLGEQAKRNLNPGLYGLFMPSH